MNKDEIIDIILVTIVLGFCFSFRNWSGNIIFYKDSIGIFNFLITTLIVLITILIHELAHSLYARKFFAEVKTKTWKSFLVLALLSTFLTNGYFVFAAVWSIAIVQTKLFSIGHRRPFLGPRKRAKIALIGPVINFIIGIIAFVIYSKTGDFFMQKLFEINFYLAIFNLFPFFRVLYLIINIPMIQKNKKGENYWQKYVHRMLSGFKSTRNPPEGYVAFNEGEMVLFGSRPYWFFFFPLILISTIMIFLTSQIFISLLVGFLVALVSWIIEHYYIEIKVKPET